MQKSRAKNGSAFFCVKDSYVFSLQNSRIGILVFQFLFSLF